MSSDPVKAIDPAWWLVRVPAVYADLCKGFAPNAVSKDGEADYRRVAADGFDFPLPPEHRIFCRWQMPVHHAWPCNPEKTEGFIEKAARAIERKFSPFGPRALMVGAFEAHTRNGYFRKLASNLRGRALQRMPEASAGVESLAANDPVLYVLLGKTGMFCGLQSPRGANGFHPGGTRFIRQSGEAVLSRAGAKIVEALHHMRLLSQVPPQEAHWLELGACPGGMTSELLRNGYRVTALDRAPLAAALDGMPGLDFHRVDVARWEPREGLCFDALLCDMNGPAETAFAQVLRLAAFLRRGSPIVFTLKTTGAGGLSEILSLHDRILAMAGQAGVAHQQTTHLSYNRREFTAFLTA